MAARSAGRGVAIGAEDRRGASRPYPGKETNLLFITGSAMRHL